MIEIRQPSSEEVADAVRLRQLVLGDLYDCDGDNNPTTIQVAAFDDEIIVATVHIEEHKEYGTYVHRMAVHPDYQRQGIGRKILRTAEQQAIARGNKVLVLYSDKAVDYFITCGYEPTGEMDGDYTKMEKVIN